MNGTYDGGNDYQSMKNGIECEVASPGIGKYFRLVVEDNDVKMTSTSGADVISLTLKHGDTFEVDGEQFELKKHERVANQNADRSSGCPCYHPHNPVDEMKAINRIDCPYSGCLFACWCIADLNEHIASDHGRQGQFSSR